MIDIKKADQFILNKLYNFNGGLTLARAYNSGENVLLTGPGGYGKTDAAALFFEFLKQEGEIKDERPFVLAFGQGMTEERLFAGIDIKKFQDEGQLIYNLQHAFVNYEYVIFEELFDAFSGVLLILKDVLQSKQVRIGETVFPIKTKFIVACTNRSGEEVAVDDSTAALLERFVFQKEVKWNSWNASDYLEALKCAAGVKLPTKEMHVVAQVAAESSKKSGKPISPRTVGKAYKAVKANDVYALSDILGFDSSAINTHATKYDSIEKDNEQTALVNAYLELIKKYVAKTTETKSAIKRLIILKKIALIETKLATMPKRDALVSVVQTALGGIKELKKSIWVSAKELIVNPPHKSLAEGIKNSTLEKFPLSCIRLEEGWELPDFVNSSIPFNKKLILLESVNHNFDVPLEKGFWKIREKNRLYVYISDDKTSTYFREDHG